MMRVRTRVTFDAARAKRQVDQASFRSLKHAGAAIRLTASRSIRRRKKPSQPGRPPHTQTGKLKRVIRYAVDQQKTEATVGPVNEFARTIWNLHEFGGRTKKRLRLLKSRRLRVGDYGPIRKKTGKGFARLRIRSEAQARRATQLVQEENESRRAESKIMRRYPRRPFMRPALTVNMPRLPKFWSNSVRS